MLSWNWGFADVRDMRASRQHELGFSLLEMVVTMAIVAMATAVAIPVISTTDPARVEGAAALSA